MVAWLFGRRGKGDDAKKGPVPDYEKAKAIAESGSEEERRRLASVTQLQPEFLYYFATDKSVDVRRAVAQNEGTPVQADLLLARDPDAHVRSMLGQKIASLLPTLSADQNRKLADMVFDIVDTLSKDQLPAVRSTISEEIKRLDNVPPRIVQRLARDSEEIVSNPILEFSPLLSERDLVDIIGMGLRGGALAAISRRKNLGEQAAGAVAETQDDFALPALLQNHTAQINEETLNAIVEAAEKHTEWHEALVGRKGLGKNLLRRIGGYVSKNLLEKLISNNVLVDDKLADELRTAVAERAEEEGDDGGEAAAEDHAEEVRARELYNAGKLTPRLLTSSASNEEREFLVHALALSLQVDPDITRKLIVSRDPKLAVSVAWKADLGMGFATTFMAKIMQLGEGAQIKAAAGNDYPLAEDDMAWTLEMIGIT